MRALSRTRVCEAGARRVRRIQIADSNGAWDGQVLEETKIGWGIYHSRSQHLCRIRVHEYTINEIHHIVCHRARTEKVKRPDRTLDHHMRAESDRFGEDGVEAESPEANRKVV